jgi:Bacterial Ig domain
MRMSNKSFTTAILAGSALLLTAGMASAQVVNLTAARQTTLLPNGASVPMWGWACGAVTQGTVAGTTCTQTNGTPQFVPTTGVSTVWQPPLITVPCTATASTATAAGTCTAGLTITLANSLPVATSLTIVGQLPNAADPNGLGNPTREAGPRTDGAHQTQNATTWTTVVTSQAPFTPPSQGNRARAFVQEAAAAGSVTYTWSALRPGTYLIETGTYPSIQGPMGLYGVLVVTAPATTAAAGTAYPAPAGALITTGLAYDADAVVLLSEIDAVQNSAVAKAVVTTGFTETAKWTYACSTTGPVATANTCYPPAVDYTPTYYLINGQSFDRTNPGASAVTPGVTTCTAASPPVCSTTTPYRAGNVLLRYVNAGSHMHLPSVVGLQTALIAEDGNLQPDVAVGMTKTAHTTCPSGITPIAGACPKVQADWFMAAGKVLDLMVQPAHTTTYTAAYYPTFDRELSLSANSIERDAGMQALVALNAGTRNVSATTGVTTLSGVTLAAGLTATTVANGDNYIVPHGATTFSGNVLANDVGIHNASSPCTAGGSTAAQAISAGSAGPGTLNPDGSFTLTAIPAAFTNGATATFSYCGNGNATYTATVTLTAARVGGVPVATADSYTSNVANLLTVSAGQGVLVNDSDPSGYPLTAVPVGGTIGAPSNTITAGSLTVVLNANGSFFAQAGAAGTYTFQYNAVNSQGTSSTAPATVTLIFPPASNLKVTVADAVSGIQILDYKWVIEQDLTFKLDPKCQVNTGAGSTAPAGCPPLTASGVPPTLGTEFHTSYMPVIAAGCTGVQSCERGQSVYDNNPLSATYQQHVPAVCTAGVCTPSNAGQVPASLPSAVHLAAFEPDGVTPARYYLSILPGDISNPFNVGFSGDPSANPNCEFLTTSSPTTPTGQQVPQCGHAMSGAQIAPPTCTVGGVPTACQWGSAGATGPGVTTPIIIPVQQNPLQTATLTIFVFEDDAPLNGEHDAGGNNREPGLGQFQVELWDDAGAAGDATGQMEHDIFNMPLSNSLNGTIDPLTGHNACPIAPTAADSNGNPNQVALGRIVVCPQYEDDGVTPSPLVGQALVRNLMPGRFGVIVHPSAAREAAGEEWIQTNTLDGSHFLDSFVRSGEPAYFQEFGPGAWHVFMGMVNPALVNARKASFCNGPPAVPCANTVNGHLSNLHMSRAPNETLFDSAVFAPGDPRNNQAFAHTTCWASLGDRDGDTFAFTKCDANGNFTFTGVPDGNWSLVVGDQWLDLIIDGSSKPVNVAGGQTVSFDSPVFTWQTHIWTNTFMDLNGNGIQDDPVAEPGLIQVPNRVRMRNGKFNNTLFSDSSGHANFNETFPYFNWLVVESDTTRFKNTGVHTVYDAGGQIDGPAPSGNGRSGKYQGLLNTTETAALAVPSALRVPGAHYCSSGDCSELANVAGFPAAGGPGGSTGRIDPGSVVAEGVQGFISQTEVLEWGKLPYLVNENGGIRGHVVYSSTRPFDDPQLLFQNLWEPLVPGVTINLYQEKLAADGTMGLALVDQTVTSSWDKYAQGFRAAGVPNMNCPGQDPNDPFFPYTLAGTTNTLAPTSALPNNSQFKCYDGMHNFNQVQPAPYDGLYQFPSQACSGAATSFTATINGAAVTVACATVPNTNFGAVGAYGSTAKILPPGKYVVEVVVPPGYELTKEEDKNILMGDNWVASATIGPQFVGLGDIFIVPDQAAINAQNASYTGPFTGAGSPYNTSGTGGVPNQNNSQPTADMGNSTLGSFGPGGLIQMPAPCVGQLRVVPDFMTISPEGGEVAPFAGALRRLCDRKEINLEDQMQGVADFFVWTKTPAASHYTGFILDDFSSEFDQASPGFGEKFAVPNLPVSIKDFRGVEISRTMSDQWGLYNGLVFSTFDVNPPNPTGYSPGMMVTCMNDPGPVIDTRPACTTAPSGTSPGSPAGCSTTTGQTITDPLFNPMYSTFCYENPFMPADTTYLDTPVVPVAAFAEAYNPPDCAYPDATPAIKSVTGDSGLSINSASGTKACTSAAVCSGPWVSATGRPITITALGDVTVLNHAYSGPAATTAPFNQKFIQRHYGFGTGATATIGGIPATCPSATDLTMTCTVPTTLPLCAHQQAGTGNGGARCGELVITTSSGQKSVDTVTVVAGGKKPTFINGENAAHNAIQSALNAATPGDEIIVGPGAYQEELLMWKPVRLQGVAAASVIVDANANSPSGRAIDAWRREVNCLFGVSLSGALLNGDPTATPPTPPAVYDPTGTYSCNFALSNGQAPVDPIPLEPIIGWNANLNGNLSELLQEPTLLGAYEGAGITVLAKGMENNNTANCQAEGSAGCILLNGSFAAGGDCNASSPFFPTNYLCNPSRIDGMSFTDSSQGGGGILLHGWNHNTEVSNNRVINNAGTLTGGITVGEAEVPDPTLGGAVCPALVGFPTPSATDAAPLCIDANVNIHNNNISLNASYGDELNSTTPSAGGGVTFTPGSDNYRFTSNWVCANLSSGDGGGLSHYGLSFNGTIAHNSFLFNQSSNPTLTTWGGGIVVEGASPDGTASENSLIDVDVAPSLSDGSGPLTIDSNLIMGNMAESGSGGGLRIELANGNDILNNPSAPSHWYGITVTNNIIANNVAGWAGGGVSIQDAVKVSFTNNTVTSNDVTASAGVLFDTLGAPNSNVPPPGCDPNTNAGCTNPVTSSNFEPAGLETHAHSKNLIPAFTTAVTCPTGHPNCTQVSIPVLDHSIFWQNRSFHITTAGNPAVITLTPPLNQAGVTGACPAGANYWDLGVYGDTSQTPGTNPGHYQLSPTNSTVTTGYSGGVGNNNTNPGFTHQYCNGSRVTPEIASVVCSPAGANPNGNANAPGCIRPGALGITTPPGIPDNNPFYENFTLTPAATVDEGNNWINMFFGPLSKVNPSIQKGSTGYNAALGGYKTPTGPSVP